MKMASVQLIEAIFLRRVDPNMIEIPVWMVHRLDVIARRLGVTRQSVIKVFISEKLKEETL